MPRLLNLRCFVCKKTECAVQILYYGGGVGSSVTRFFNSIHLKIIYFIKRLNILDKQPELQSRITISKRINRYSNYKISSISTA